MAFETGTAPSNGSVTMTSKLLEAELALKQALDDLDTKAIGIALANWRLERFPPAKEWVPAPGDFVRWNHPRDGEGKICQIREISKERFRIFSTPDTNVSYDYWYPIDLIRYWVPQAEEWVRFRGGDALAGYSYVVTLSYMSFVGDAPASGILVRLRGIDYPIPIDKLIPCLDAKTRCIGPGGGTE